MADTEYLVSARKYRPARFSSVVGQKTLTATLKNAITTGRLAQAYLFCGPRGVGKTSCARIFARTINCLSPDADGEACGKCASCVDFDSGNSYNIIELDAASNNSVDDIRVITEQVNVPPQVGKYRVFIIDEVHMLTSSAFNAFLKTLEEPPKYVVFILATTEKHKVIPTILSRCQTYDFRRITIDDMVEHLGDVARQEGLKAEKEALGVIARKADGAMRDALSIFDQVAASTRGNLTYDATIASLNVLDHDYYFRLIDTFRTGDVPEALLIYKEIRDKGFDSLFFINGLASHIRDLMVSADSRTLPLLELASDEARKFGEQAKSLPLPWYYAAMGLLNDCDLNYRTASSKQLLVELTLIRLCQLLKPAQPPFDSVGKRPELRDPTVCLSSAPKEPAAKEASAQTNNIADRLEAVAQPAAPATAPTMQHSTPRQAMPTGVKKRSTVKISNILSVPGENVSHEKRSTPVTDDIFNRGINAFIESNPDKHLLTSTLRNASHKRTSETGFTFSVDHPAAVQALDSNIRLLLDFMRDYTKNDYLEIHAETDTSKEESKALSNQELLRKIGTVNPDLGKWLLSINAEIL